MKFLIQKCNGKVTHDFSFTLLESIRFKNWLTKNNDIKVKFVDTDPEAKEIDPTILKPMHRNYVPIGSVEFVSFFLEKFYGLTPKPVNVPEELFHHIYSRRPIINGNHKDLEDRKGMWFIKSNDKIKGFSEILRLDDKHVWNIPAGNYQISEFISVQSEWRAFIYKGKLVGLQNYCGEFTVFPDPVEIKRMIKAYKSAPVAYTLDVGVNDHHTFVIECHDFFSCGLYGFSDHTVLPNMFYRWFWQYIQIEMVKQKQDIL